MFKLGLNRAGYIAIVIGLFPAPSTDIDLDPTDSILSLGAKSAALRPVSADIIAEQVVGWPELPHLRGPGDVNTSTGIYIGRESYPDPVTGRRTDKTVTTTEVALGFGGPARRSCRGYDGDPMAPFLPVSQRSPVQTGNATSQKLWEKSLLEGKTVHPVAPLKSPFDRSRSPEDIIRVIDFGS